MQEDMRCACQHRLRVGVDLWSALSALPLEGRSADDERRMQAPNVPLTVAFACVAFTFEPVAVNADKNSERMERVHTSRWRHGSVQTQARHSSS